MSAEVITLPLPLMLTFKRSEPSKALKKIEPDPEITRDRSFCGVLKSLIVMLPAPLK